MKKAIKIFIPVLVMAMLFTACTSASKNNDDNLEDGVNAVENAMTTKGNQENKNNNTDDLRTGNSNNTVPTPSDFPSEYNYGTGKLSDYSRNAMLKKMPTPMVIKLYQTQKQMQARCRFSICGKRTMCLQKQNSQKI